MKRQKTIFIFGSILVGLIATLLVFIMLLVTGVVSTDIREITITSFDYTKEYDGEAAKFENYKLLDGSLKGDDHLVIKFLNNYIDAGSYSNDYEVQVLDSNNVDVTSNYKINKKYGIITINRKPLTINVNNLNKTYDGKPLQLTVKDFNYNEGGLAKGDYIDFNTLTYSEVITEPKKITAKCKFAIYNSNRYDSNDLKNLYDNYEIIQNGGSMTIDKVNITLSTVSLEKQYDGTELTTDVKSFTCNPLIDTSKFEFRTSSWTSITYVGEVYNGPTGSKNEDIHIFYKDGTSLKDVTEFFNITRNYGKLKVTEREIHVKSPDIELKYNGQDQKNEVQKLQNDRKPLISNLPTGYDLEISYDQITSDLINTAAQADNKFSAKLVKKDGSNITSDELKNFKIVPTYGKITISKINLQIYADDYEATYNGQKQNVKSKPIAVGLLDGDELVMADDAYRYIGDCKDADDYKFTIDVSKLVVKDKSGNIVDYYNLPTKPITGTFTINKEKIVIQTGTKSPEESEEVSSEKPLVCGDWEILKGNIKANDDLIVTITGILTGKGIIDNTAVGYVLESNVEDGKIKYKESENYDIEFIYGALINIDTYEFEIYARPYDIKGKESNIQDSLKVTEVSIDDFINNLSYSTIDKSNNKTPRKSIKDLIEAGYKFTTESGKMSFIECDANGNRLDSNNVNENINLKDTGVKYFIPDLTKLKITNKDGLDVTSQYKKVVSPAKLHLYKEEINIKIPDIELEYGVYNFEEEYAKIDKNKIKCKDSKVNLSSLKITIEAADLNNVGSGEYSYKFVSVERDGELIVSANYDYLVKISGKFKIKYPPLTFKVPDESIEITYNQEDSYQVLLEKWYKSSDFNIVFEGLAEGHRVEVIGSDIAKQANGLIGTGTIENVSLNIVVWDKESNNVSDQYDIKLPKIDITFVE